MPFPLNINFPSITCSSSGLCLELASSINLDLPDDVPAESWRELIIIRGNGLNVKIKLRWNGHFLMNDTFIEILGRAISKSKLWTQLLFSVSLEIPGLSSNHTQDDIILNLTRAEALDTRWSPSAVEGQIAVHLPTACLTTLHLSSYINSLSNTEFSGTTFAATNTNTDIFPTYKFDPRMDETLYNSRQHQCQSRSQGNSLCEPRKCTFAIDLLSLLDTAITSLIATNLAPIAPCIFCPGSLESLWHSVQYISSISDSFLHVHRSTKDMDLKQKLSILVSNNSGGVESSLWRLAKQKLLNPRSRPLESLMSWGLHAEDILSTLEAVDFLSASKQDGREVEELLDHGFQETSQAHNENDDIDDMILQPKIALYGDTLDVLRDDSLWLDGFLHNDHEQCSAASIQRDALATEAEEMLFEEASLLFTKSSEEEDQAEDDEMLL